MLFKHRLLTLPLSLPLLLTAACGGGGDNKDKPDASTSVDVDASIAADVCTANGGPATTLSAYPAIYAGNVLGAGADYSVAEGICLDERSHFSQEGEDQAIRLNNLTPGAPYVVEVVSAADLSFYVVTDCAGAEIVANDCLLFADQQPTKPELADFAAPDSGTVYIIVDRFDDGPIDDGSYSLSVYEAACTVDADCSGTPDTPTCLNYSCVECVNSFQCDSTDAPVCDGATKTCVAGFDTCTGDDATPPESGDDGPSGATVLTLTADMPTVVNAKICSAPANELDFYSFTIVEGDSRAFALNWTSATADLDLYLFNADGILLKNSVNDQPEVIPASGLAAGTYYLAVSKFETDGTGVAAAVDYTLTAPLPNCATSFDCDLPAAPFCGPAFVCEAGPTTCTGDLHEPNSGPAAATPLVNGEVTASAICNTPEAEVDYFSIVVAATDNLAVSVAYADNMVADLDVEVLDENGTTLGFTYWSNPEVVSLSYLPAGTYYIKVRYFGAPVTAAYPYTITATTSTNVMGCVTAADCAVEHSTQLFRGSCNAGACSFIDGAGALAQDAGCDSDNDCTSGSCSYALFQASAETSVCTTLCTANSECVTAHGAGFSCTVPYDDNFCHPDCTSNLECGANIGSPAIDAGETWDYLTCTAGVCNL